MSKTPFEAYKLYIALKQHFTTDYDFIKYNGKVKANVASFEKRPDYRRFVALAKKPELQDFIVANLVSGQRTNWVGDLLTPEAEQCYFDWRARNEAIEYRFREQLLFLNDDFDSNFVVSDRNHPKLFRLMIEGALWPETPVVFNRLVKFSKRWDRQMPDDYMWSHWRTFVQKYDAFVRCDNEKIKSLILSRFEHSS